MDTKRQRQDFRSINERRSSTKRSKIEQVPSNPVKKKTNVNAVVFDNGAYSIKVGYAKDNNPTSLPNYIMKAKSERKRCFIADQIEDCRDLSGLFFIMPNERGYISKFDVQKTIWDYTFQKFPIDDVLIMTQPIFNFRTVQEYTDEIFFEEYNVKMYHRANATDLSYYEYVNNVKETGTSCVIVDSGYSFTHVVPYIEGKKYAKGIIRLDVGGKLLTNYLKDILSYRQLHVMEEMYVINHVKEDTCFMSLDFKADMQKAKSTNSIVKNYILPDFHNVRRGYVQDQLTDELTENYQILRLNNERITVPEILVRPSIIPGMDRAGLPQCIAECIKRCPRKYQKTLASNVVLTGGNCLFPGFKERILEETRMFIPSHHDLSVYMPKDPINYAWIGGQSLSKDPKLSSVSVTKLEYEEYGSSYAYNRFNEYCTSEDQVSEKVKNTSFSYLKYWDKEGADLFNKAQMSYVPSENDVEFMLEGDGIEELDDKYVTVEFEYEDSETELTNKNMKVSEEVKIRENEGNMQKRKKIAGQDFYSPASASPSNSSSQSDETILRNNPVAYLPQLVRQNLPKVYKPIFRQKTDTKVDPKRPQIVTLTNNSMALSSGSIIVPSSGNFKAVFNSRHVVNGSVILPQNILPRNVKFQLIPLNSELLHQGSVILTQNDK